MRRIENSHIASFTEGETRLTENDKFVEKTEKGNERPRWSKPNYTNTTTEEEKEILDSKRKYYRV